MKLSNSLHLLVQASSQLLSSVHSENLPLRGFQVSVSSYESENLGYSFDIDHFKALFFSISIAEN
ncbi:hypothetical protein EU94_1120 [Prochlorococcus marinus str. MIT 9123]|uniref:hypothetical protein n=1 Tax=Prochlorococcus TaxID=1218 RepID=UPI000533B4DF|nr:hypothetical protein [Prochlorococcus marinus]KGF93925.1 hypothetical protein EU94_1120 [Prochlorococcus marinus str. MIT 9123]